MYSVTRSPLLFCMLRATQPETQYYQESNSVIQARKEEKEKDIVESLRKFNEETHPRGETLPGLPCEGGYCLSKSWSSPKQDGIV